MLPENKKKDSLVTALPALTIKVRHGAQVVLRSSFLGGQSEEKVKYPYGMVKCHRDGCVNYPNYFLFQRGEKARYSCLLYNKQGALLETKVRRKSLAAKKQLRMKNLNTLWSDFLHCSKQPTEGGSSV